jgi:hypothetical protein
MTQVTESTAPVRLADLPPLGGPLAGGEFAGLITKPDGAHCAIALLPDRAEKLTHQEALDWAAELAGELPTRPIAALLHANCKDKLSPTWHWTSEIHANDASYAGICDFNNGGQNDLHRSWQAGPVAVRLIPISA